MTSPQQAEELEIRRRSQELAVAWRKGRAAFVLDSLSAEEPLRAGLIGSLVHETLSRWYPYDSRWPSSFRHALLVRSQGEVTPYELAELEDEYRRRFGSRPPLPAEEPRSSLAMCLQMERIGQALESGEPIVPERAPDGPPRFLRRPPERRSPTLSSR